MIYNAEQKGYFAIMIREEESFHVVDARGCRGKFCRGTRGIRGPHPWLS